jgi:hypothetical protein
MKGLLRSQPARFCPAGAFSLGRLVWVTTPAVGAATVGVDVIRVS